MYNNVICETFDSMTKLLKAIDERPVNDLWQGQERSSQRIGSRFTGTEDYAEAKSLAINGWGEHLSKIRKGVVSGNLKADKTSITRRRPQNSVIGFAPNVPNAILGLPESMITIKQQPQKVKAITIIFNTSVIADWEVEEILDSGVAVLQLINNIERRGVKVKLISEFKSSRNNNEVGIARVVLKDFKDSLDLKKVAFPFANASMQRRIGFAWLETVHGLKVNDWVWSYGQSLGDVHEYRELLGILKEHNLINDNEYYITIPWCTRECHNDPEQLMKNLNIKF